MWGIGTVEVMDALTRLAPDSGIEVLPDDGGSED